ncbi:hypothetical protein A374_14065 [Fictibacillus macauensis ZFHKF-1]|uniref:DUF4288 domain-containing protein n=1 Tax=Fictibacillus macauensis ZFHKF-1 TaxID=1196324 RepID=I8UDD5_9BACL|nr:DUF4288 domain-containing protein [Fictibacillus macauensis]EIT84823.1 hypothetical protein A374_14065 [Fictibacillus macauensis ZFHKF-1]
MAKETKSWYTAALLFEAVHDGEPHHVDEHYDPFTKTYEESHIILFASSREEAVHMAQALGKDKEHTYQNSYGERVSWQFIRMIDCYELSSHQLASGTEVFSRMILTSHEESPNTLVQRFM